MFGRFVLGRRSRERAHGQILESMRMSIDVNSRHVLREPIDLNDPLVVRHWIEKWGVSFHELRAAVMKAGSSPDAVEQVLEEAARKKDFG